MAEMSSQQVDDLLFDLRRLIETLNSQRDGTKGLAETKAIADNTKSTDKLILAMGKLAAQMDSTVRTRAEEQKYMKRFAADTDRASEAQQKQRVQINQNIAAAKKELEEKREAARLAARTQQQIDQERIAAEKKTKEAATKQKDQSVRDLTATLRERRQQTSVSRELFEQLSNTGGTAERLKNGFQDLAGNNLALQSTFQLLTATVTGTTAAMKSFSSALHQGRRGASVSADALGNLAEPILNTTDAIGNLVSLLSLFVPGGIFVRGAIFVGGQLLSLGSEVGKVAVEMNKLAAQQIDALFKSFRQLSTVGASGARGLDSVFDTLQLMGMSVAELEEFNSLITENSRSLAFMGTTVADGAREFARISGSLYKSELGEQLEMLGMSATEQREAALAYMNIQARTGRLELKNTTRLIEKSAEFARELDLAAQLTGQTRKDQAAAREAALAEVRFRAALIQAQQTGDTERLKRLDAAQQAAAVAKAFGDERGFRGILQYAAGGMTTPEAVAAEQTYRISQILAQPNMSQMQMAQHMGESVRLQQQQLAGATALVGNIDALSTDFVKTADFQQRIANLIEEANRQGLTGPDALQRVLETEQGKRIAAGGDTQLMVEAGRLQQGAAMMQDAALSKFNVAANINKTASDLFKQAVDMFAEVVGVPTPSGGVPTVRGGQQPGGAGAPPSGGGGGGGGGAGGGVGGGVGSSELDFEGALGSMQGTPMSAPATPPALVPRSAAPGTSGGRNDAQGGGRASTRQILDFIAQVESNGNYNIVNGGSTLPLTNMTVQQVLEAQRNWRSWPGATSSAVGRYQIIRGTLEGLLAQGVASPTDRFNSATQDRLGTALLVGRGLEQWQSGAIPTSSFATALSMEWASLPKDASNSGYYDGVGNNRALHTWQDTISMLGGARSGGVFAGPSSGYGVKLHGTEAVVPLPDGKSIPVSIEGPRSTFRSVLGGMSDFGGTSGSTSATAGGSDVARELRSAIESLRSDLREAVAMRGGAGSPDTARLLSDLVDLQRKSNSTAERILQVSQS